MPAIAVKGDALSEQRSEPPAHLTLKNAVVQPDPSAHEDLAGAGGAPAMRGIAREVRHLFSIPNNTCSMQSQPLHLQSMSVGSDIALLLQLAQRAAPLRAPSEVWVGPSAATRFSVSAVEVRGLTTVGDHRHGGEGHQSGKSPRLIDSRSPSRIRVLCVTGHQGVCPERTHPSCVRCPREPT